MTVKTLLMLAAAYFAGGVSSAAAIWAGWRWTDEKTKRGGAGHVD